MPETMVGGWECCRCDNVWAKRKDTNKHPIKPLRCPSCGSCYWNIPKKTVEETKDGTKTD